MCFGSNQQSTKFDPPDWAKDYFPDILGTASQLASQPKGVYAGLRVSPRSDWTQTAAQMTADRAMYGAPDLNAARGAAMGISSGQYMNPYANNAYADKTIADNAADMVSAYQGGEGLHNSLLMARKGAFGGSADIEKQTKAEAALADRVGKMANQVRFGQQNLGANLYQQDIQNILNASQLSGQLSQDDWMATQQLGGVGKQHEDYVNKLLGVGYDEFQSQQQHPYAMLDWLMGKTSQSSGQYGTNYSSGGGASGAATAGGVAALIASMLGK